MPPRRHSTPTNSTSIYNPTTAATISAMLSMGSAESGSSGGNGNEFLNPLQHHQQQQRSQSFSLNAYSYANANNDHNVGTSTTGNNNNNAGQQQDYQNLLYSWNNSGATTPYETAFDIMGLTEGGGGPIGFGNNHSGPNNTNP